MKGHLFKFPFSYLILSLAFATAPLAAEETSSSPPVSLKKITTPGNTASITQESISARLSHGRIKITNPHCLACLRETRSLLLQTKGIESVTMIPDLLNNPKVKARHITIELEFDSKQTNPKKLRQLLREHDLEVIY
jgi:hypothetical protein